MDGKARIEFEQTEYLEHLPNSRAIKSFVRCYGKVSKGVRTKSNKLILRKFADYFGEFMQNEEKLYITMATGCRKQTKHIKHIIEVTYAVSVYNKDNDNEPN